MARPPKKRVDWFEHDADAYKSNTAAVLKKMYGDRGYAFWWYLLESLASSDGYYLDCSKQDQFVRLKSKTELSDADVEKCLDTLATLGAIDELLWNDHHIVWCENLIRKCGRSLKRRVGSVSIPVAIQPAEKEPVLTHGTEYVEQSAFGPVIVDKVVCYIENEIPMSPNNIQEMQDYREILGDDLVIWAVDESVAANVREWRYTKRILQNMVKKNVKSVAEAKALKERRAAERASQRNGEDDTPVKWVRV